MRRAKDIAKRRLRRHEARMLSVFGSVLRLPREKLHCDMDECARRIDDAAFVRNRPDIYGETDGDSIWISKDPMTFADLVNTLVHEAVHDAVCVVARTRSGEHKSVPCAIEHKCMKLLGERQWCCD